MWTCLRICVRLCVCVCRGGGYEIQQVTCTLSSGTFMLGYEGAFTTAIPFGSGTATIAAALQALTTCAPAVCVCMGARVFFWAVLRSFCLRAVSCCCDHVRAFVCVCVLYGGVGCNLAFLDFSERFS